MAFGFQTARTVAFGAGALVTADLITGMAAYSVITLAALWYFCWSWLQLASEAAVRGVAFSSAAQLQWAWFGTLALLPMIPLVLHLAVQAYRLPAGLAHEARRPGSGRLRGLFAGTP
jgi:hypothetical protein